MNQFIDEIYPLEQRAAEGEALNLAAWEAPLWDAIHFWAAGLGRDLMRKHVAGLLKRWGRIPGQAEAVVLVDRVVERALMAERDRIRRELLGRARRAYRAVTPADRLYLEQGAFEAILDEVCPEEEE